jgi:hypothetical protein
MRRFETVIKIALLVVAVLPLAVPMPGRADPSKYPQFAQQELPRDITPVFISVDELADAIVKGAKPLIIDVRSTEEFNEAHILGARSAPLTDFREYMKGIPRDRVTILY